MKQSKTFLYQKTIVPRETSGSFTYRNKLFFHVPRETLYYNNLLLLFNVSRGTHKTEFKKSNLFTVPRETSQSFHLLSIALTPLQHHFYLYTHSNVIYRVLKLSSILQ